MKTKQINKKNNQTKPNQKDKKNPYIKKPESLLTQISGEILLTTAKVILQCKKRRAFYRLC